MYVGYGVVAYAPPVVHYVAPPQQCPTCGYPADTADLINVYVSDTVRHGSRAPQVSQESSRAAYDVYLVSHTDCSHTRVLLPLLYCCTDVHFVHGVVAVYVPTVVHYVAPPQQCPTCGYPAVTADFTNVYVSDKARHLLPCCLQLLLSYYYCCTTVALTVVVMFCEARLSAAAHIQDEAKLSSNRDPPQLSGPVFERLPITPLPS